MKLDKGKPTEEWQLEKGYVKLINDFDPFGKSLFFAALKKCQQSNGEIELFGENDFCDGELQHDIFEYSTALEIARSPKQMEGYGYMEAY